MSVSTRRGFFGVVTDPQSFINIFYLLLSFPLGIAYFVFLSPASRSDSGS